jgi:hypothetical protein
MKVRFVVFSVLFLRIQVFWDKMLDILTLADEETTPLQNIRNHSPSDSVTSQKTGMLIMKALH